MKDTDKLADVTSNKDSKHHFSAMTLLYRKKGTSYGITLRSVPPISLPLYLRSTKPQDERVGVSSPSSSEMRYRRSLGHSVCGNGELFLLARSTFTGPHMGNTHAQRQNTDTNRPVSRSSEGWSG